MGHYVKRYTLFGIAFGLAFPVMSLGLDLGVFHPAPFNLDNLKAIHLQNPLHFIIDSAPLFLGLAFGIAGRFLDRASAANVRLKETHADLASKHEEVLNQAEEMLAQKELLESQAMQLSQSHERVKSSLNYARRIQRATLAKELDLNQDLASELFIYLRPKDIVCGDFYWMHEDDNYRYLATIDCTGHGVPSAFMTLIGNNLLNNTVIQEGISSPAEILARLDQSLLETLRNDEDTNSESINDGMDVAICRIDKASREVVFAGAKRPAVLVNAQQVTVAKGGKYPIGSFQFDEKDFFEEVLTYTPGDMLYLFTDGLPDQFGGQHNRKFMNKAFREVLQQHCEEPLPQQKKHIDKVMRDWQGERSQTDDMLLIGVRL